MNKKHFIGMLIVLLISGFVIWQELRKTPVKALWGASKKLNINFLLLVLLVMVLSYACEAAIIWILEHKKGEPHRSAWSFFRIPIIQALFNAITPLSTGGQPSQLVAMIQMGIEGGRATSILLMKFIIYQICVLFAYVSTIIFGFHMVITKFSGLALFIFIGFILHVSSIIFLLAIMFAYHWTKSATNWLMNLLERFMNKNTVEKWRKNTMEKIETFYAEGQNLKREKKKLLGASILTIGQLLCFYSIPYLILLALNLTPSWLEVTQMNIMIIMFMAIVPIPGASGGAEFSFQTLFTTFIHSNILLTLGMFLWRFTTYFFGMILGIFGWLFKPKKIRSH
ncbi:lysylphosphatidylglycerol synthase transmembrane domain-containing protein [Lactobacillus paragasseri]|uniref:lysylphosphatidylglycerol synthase transmembrane domain-containing protein n=1 Tax=Lactobacillus paragasseri TaxID=2107999 RepID=UPI0012E2A61C|nr:lysylphosphatidylglycerol synthase transmembrane domain-containing protein [Lactobacillus paragasseri]MDK8087285.1 lysylphosphatidylglycerol synthase transmembrane domain-containing protein [Lactobacillus paragasseri]MDX5119214.1 lysylphosphatidylglycerol synthase transmembrane domain-containing protein [Lactobacillus paragasseri]MDX5123095.1 lysylphosphatidylglycerol synthase transmembrane domain-containing protein [Lactobacillus paragasseri]QGT98274.1 flippase-like domain-containing protei